jgi:AcrR family transcriptional regulator
MDRRTLKTQKAIREAFLNLLGKKSLNKITVAELSQLADLGRGTFYLHYKDVYDLYSNIENTIYSEIELLLDHVCINDSSEYLKGLTHEITDYIFNNRTTFLLLNGIENNGKTLYKLRDIFHKKMILDNPDLYQSDYHVVECMFAISGVIGVLEEWLFRNTEMSQTQIAESLYRILHKFEM